MASSFRVQDHFHSFEDWETVWHLNFKRRNPKYKQSMYMDGQFDEFPYIMWDDNELISEFDYHDELLEYKGKLD